MEVEVYDFDMVAWRWGWRLATAAPIRPRCLSLGGSLGLGQTLAAVCESVLRAQQESVCVVCECCMLHERVVVCLMYRCLRVCECVWGCYENVY